ncbi:MAG: HEAT repeat domain-containing protein [Pirellulales bacterium]|nr:HEAT repeat domain-containing protein [Pirellulales bacterium]
MSQLGLADDQVDDFSRRLKQAHSDNEQLEVLEEIRKNASIEGSPRLLELISDSALDRDPEVRFAAVLALAQISYEHKTFCPESLISALLDLDAEVRRAAHENIIPEAYIGLPKNTLSVAKQALREERYRDIRASCATILQYTRLDEEATRLLIDAMSDRDFLVRNNAAAALYRHVAALEKVAEFYVAVALCEIKDRNFYSSTLGWDELGSDFIAMLRPLAMRRLNEMAMKHPDIVSKMLVKRLQSKDQRNITIALAQITSPSPATNCMAKKLTEPVVAKKLSQLAQSSNLQVSELAHMAEFRLSDSQIPIN